MPQLVVNMKINVHNKNSRNLKIIPKLQFI